MEREPLDGGVRAVTAGQIANGDHGRRTVTAAARFLNAQRQDGRGGRAPENEDARDPHNGAAGVGFEDLPE
jgi:hypothetical protein